MEEEKKSTDVEGESDDIISLLPKSPTLKDVDNNERSLQLILESRKTAIDLYSLIDTEWKVLK